MHTVIKKGMEYELFSNDVISSFYTVIQNEVLKMLSKEKNPKPCILGAFALHDVPLKNGGVSNVWIEYNGKILPGGLVDMGVHNCIIYDRIPDIVLDKFNEINTLLFSDINNQK